MPREDYQHIKEAGGGGYGKLYKARQPKLDRDVALKIVNTPLEGGPDALAHAKAMAKVEHENIVKIFGFENFDLLDDGNSHDVIVMQWLPGETLESCLAGERFSAQDAIRICTGVIDGLIALHHGNVAHGDLHSQNVMIVDGNWPVIIDAHAVEQAFLSQQSVTTREAKVSQDIGFCRNVVVKTLRHSMVSAVTAANLDTNLVRAATLQEIKKVVEGFGDGNLTEVSVGESSASLQDEVLDCIESNKPIRLQRLIVAKTKAARTELISDRFFCQANQLDAELVRNRVKEFDLLLQPLMEVLATGGYWGNTEHQKHWKETVESLANIYETQDHGSRAGKVTLLELRCYPPLLALYVCGFAAWLNGKFDTLYQLLRNTTFVELGRRQPLPHKVFLWKAQNRELWNKYVLDNQNQYVPISEYLLEVVTKAVEPLTLLDSNELENAFDDFEYFCGLVEAYKNGESLDGSGRTWGLVGRFIYRSKELSGISLAEEFSQRFTDPNWDALKSGFFGGEISHFRKTILNFEDFCNRVRSEKGIF